ncbi:MAG: hypothetical protein ACK41W_12205 [Cyanobacteriota bacterium]
MSDRQPRAKRESNKTCLGLEARGETQARGVGKKTRKKINQFTFHFA